MPLWDLIPAVRDGSIIANDASQAILTEADAASDLLEGGLYIGFSSGWIRVAAESSN